MPDDELKEILIGLVTVVASLEEELRSLQVLTTHLVNHSVTERLGIPQKSNTLHVQVQSLREKVNKFLER
jgi:hypothetical protein